MVLQLELLHWKRFHYLDLIMLTIMFNGQSSTSSASVGPLPPTERRPPAHTPADYHQLCNNRLCNNQQLAHKHHHGNEQYRQRYGCISIDIVLCIECAPRVAPCRKQRDLSHVAYHALYDPEFLIQLLHSLVKSVVLFSVVRQEQIARNSDTVFGNRHNLCSSSLQVGVINTGAHRVDDKREVRCSSLWASRRIYGHEQIL